MVRRVFPTDLLRGMPYERRPSGTGRGPHQLLLVPVGKLPAGVLSWLGSALPPILHCVCQIGPALAHPDYAWNARRQQYLADAVLARVQVGSARCALAVADLDLYVPDLNFVFGLADRGQLRAIIALPRLRQSFYGLSEDTDLFRSRVIKEAVHELGHLFGLEHCNNRRCVMAFSNSLPDTDHKAQYPCEKCNARLAGGEPDPHR